MNTKQINGVFETAIRLNELRAKFLYGNREENTIEKIDMSRCFEVKDKKENQEKKDV